VERRARWRWFAGAALLAALVFGALTWIVLANNNAPTAVDLNVESFVVAHRSAWATDLMKVLTWLGSSALLVPLSLLVGGYFLLRRRDWRPLALLGVGLGVAIFWSSLVKGLVKRPRPPLADGIGLTFRGWAFPSGHATQSLAGWTLLAVIAAGVMRRRQWVPWAVAAVVILVVGFSRIYLGAHWLTDVLGGWSLAAAWVLVVLTFARTRS